MMDYMHVGFGGLYISYSVKCSLTAHSVFTGLGLGLLLCNNIVTNK